MNVQVTRGNLVESVHHVAAAAVTPRGDVILSTGDISSPVFLRSTAKPFIAAAAIAAGVRERFGLDMREIAVMAVSHTGEPFHIEAVESILRKIGVDESALQCGGFPTRSSLWRISGSRQRSPTWRCCLVVSCW